MDNNGDRSFSEVLESIVDNIRTIIRSEVRLAKTEIQEQGVRAGKAGRMLGAGGLMAVFAVGFLLLACVYALEIVVAPWLAALIVMVLAGAVAGGLIGAGLKRMKQVDARPEQTIQTIKENLEWAKDRSR
jgi:uncharacterized membrane protein YqjE